MKLSTLAIVSFAAVTAVTSIASAVPSFGSVSPTKANGDFIPGGGIPSNGFTIDTALTGESVAMKARNRAFPGQPILQVANRYVVSNGQDPSNAARAAWNFDFQFSPGANSTAVSTDYTYELQADLNPAFGLASFTTIAVPPTLQVAPAGDSYSTNPGTWTRTDPFVIANSQNYTFGFLGGAGFTNAGPAEYELIFTARSAATGAVVASTTIFAEVVPEPTTLTVLGAAGVLGLRRRRA